MIFTINLGKLIERRIPWAIKSPNRIAWIKAIHTHLVNIADDFGAWRISVNEKLKLSGQTIYMEHLLNDMFDPADRQIYIQTNTQSTTLFIFQKTENVHFYVSKIYDNSKVYNTGDYVNYAGKTYKALQQTSGSLPDQYPTVWEFQGDSYCLIEADYTNTYDFSVVVVDQFATNSLTAQIENTVNEYLVAGKNFNIEYQNT